MAHRVYTTEGLVLQKTGVGEKSLSALILMPQFGLLRVRAQGARGIEGKLRFALEPLTLGSFSFISGRHGARLIGAQASEHLLLSELHASRAAVGNITRLLMRLLPGEEAHIDLFNAIVEGFRFMQKSPEAQIPQAECALVLRILRELGYLPEDPLLSRIASLPLSEELLVELEGTRPHAVRTINRVLSETGL